MKDEIIQTLSEKLPPEAIQKTKKEDTRKGYDTDGYSYQYCVDRFNNVLGNSWGFEWSIIDHREGNYKSGTSYHEITVSLGIWIKAKENMRFCVGGHIAATYADALKGAITNAFKKTAAFWGVGRDAYAGTIDDDNKPLPDHNENKVNKPKIKSNKTAEEAKKFFADFKSADKDVNTYYAGLTDRDRYILSDKCNWSIPEIDAEIIRILLENQNAIQQ